MINQIRRHPLKEGLLRLLSVALLWSALFPALALAAYDQRNQQLDQVLGEQIVICTEQGMVQMGLDEYRQHLQLERSLAWTDAVHELQQPYLPKLAFSFTVPDSPRQQIQLAGFSGLKLSAACSAARPRAPPVFS